MCERNPVMATLLRHALCAAQNDEDPWLREVTSRMTLLPRDACSLDAPSLADVDTIYLDPMFRVSRKAAPGKGMQALNLLLDGDAAEDSLLTWALRQRVQRVVVKRPRRAAALPGPSPGHVLTGRSVRFDVYPGAAGTGRHD
jgi:16S rRNA (guanine1516-N2)-methyltransferase